MMYTKGDYIAVFDSGVGGISVLRQLRKLMPNEKYVYFGDSANAPYGKRTTAVTQTEMDHRAKFAAVCIATNDRLIDPEQMPIDQMAFKAQSKYKTLRQYVFNQEWQAYQG